MNDIDLSLFEDPELVYPNAPFLEPPVIAPSAIDFHELSSKMDQISVDVNTQHLRSKLEKCKRQRLSSTIRNIEREIAALSNTINQTQTNITKLNQQIESLVLMRNGDLAQLTTITYRCLSRMHNIIITILPYMIMPTRSHEDLAQLAHELLCTIYQLPISRVSESESFGLGFVESRRFYSKAEQSLIIVESESVNFTFSILKYY